MAANLGDLRETKGQPALNAMATWSDRRLIWAEVVAAGPTVRTIEPTDRVLFSPDTGFEVEIRGEEYLILRERDVHAIASTRAEGQSGLYL